jgi:hypothetical protein
MRIKYYILSAVVIGSFLILLTSCPPKPPVPPVVIKGDSSLLIFGKNFYETAELFAQAYKPKSDTFEEGSTFNQVDRMTFTWSHRLFPDGDCQRASIALNNYVYEYDKYSEILQDMTVFIPDWVSLGPNGMPYAANGNQHGVGQMHRITFHPEYNGMKNKTIFASSSYGGLWVTYDNGNNWKNLNTDLLPFCSVADACINPKDPNQIFIATGIADDGFAAKYDPNWYHANPIFTFGIYRSGNNGVTWEAINNGFQPGFVDGGTCRRIIINPDFPDYVFVATTRGVYRSEKATSENPGWEIVLKADEALDIEFRGLEFKPGNPNVVYASGTDIYKSESNGDYGTWKSMTGSKMGIDLRDDPNFTVKRINITVTPAAPDSLYAYVEGYKNENGAAVDGCKILLFDGKLWNVIHSQFNSGGGTNIFTSGYLGIAVSPKNANQIYYGNTIVWGTDNYPASPFEKKADYFNSSGFHADVHDLKFQPASLEVPVLYCAHHGGISVKTIPSSPAVQGWTYKSNGLSVATMWAFDDGLSVSDFVMTAHQDCGTNIYQPKNTSNQWTQVKGGDGYSARVNDVDPTLAFHSAGNKSFYRFKSSGLSYTTNTEVNKLPPDPTNTGDPFVMIPKTFPMVNHPSSKKMVFGFAEVYERQMDIPLITTPIGELWKIKSNINQTIPEAWKRQITELAIAPSNPDIYYVVTGGQQNEPSATWQLESSLFKGTTNTTNPTGPLVFVEKGHPGKNLSSTNLAIITGIAVDPQNANRIWITYTGYWNQFKVWHSRDGGSTWTNADPGQQLFNIPVNAIVYQEGTKDRLFIGTDAGVYVSENGLAWKKFGRLPNVRVTEMKINKSINKLRVATYGRGLWECTLPPSN